ncbi:MAG: hypothetical protein LBT60_07735 [Oscillospiraceae bacterium]|jgi:hypothetical protein|nr:hypothetical protein [Oscillospiraceae bacterium]
MWLSKQSVARPDTQGPSALRGTVTLSGAEVAAFTDAERRGIAVCGPGGYAWRPSVGDEVLVLKDADGRKSYLVAALPAAVPGLAPGEVCIRVGQAELRLMPDGEAHLKTGLAAVVLNPDGGLDLNGLVRVNGNPLILGGE